jgi:hypothetical protein
MASNKNKNFSRIVSADPISLISYEYYKKEIKLHNLEKNKKDTFTISYIPSKDIIFATIDISRNIPDSDLRDAIEIKVYDELGLDSTINYSITYLETETNDTNNRIYNVFVIDAAVSNARLSEIKKHTKYVDYATGAPFLIQSLYKKAFIEPDGTDCFVYFQKEDAFLAIYRDGEYVYSKSLHYSLTQINEKFCELIGERIDDKDFEKLLTKDGPKGVNLDYQQHLMKLFGEIFLYINDILIYAKRSYSLESIDKIYIGSEVGVILGVEEYAQSYLGLETYDFNFNIAKNSKDWYIDQIQVMMILTAQFYFEEKDDSLNFSSFKRPPPLSQRPLGKLMGVLAASLVLSFSYPAYQLGYSYFLQLKLSQQSKEYKKLNLKTTAIKRELATLKKQEEKLKKLLGKEQTKFNFRKKLLTQIYEKKISYPMKALILAEIFKISNRYHSKIKDVEFKDDKFTLDVQNRSDKKITEFIKSLTALNKYNINTEKIEKVDKKQMYISKITVGLNNE